MTQPTRFSKRQALNNIVEKSRISVHSKSVMSVLKKHIWTNILGPGPEVRIQFLVSDNIALTVNRAFYCL